MVLLIRREQLDIFSSIRLEEFRERAVGHVDKCWPRESRTLGVEGVRMRVDESIEDAMSRGLQSEQDVILFIDLAFLLDPVDRSATDQPWINDIFSEPGMSPSRKVKVVWRQATEALRSPVQSKNRGGGRT